MYTLQVLLMMVVVHLHMKEAFADVLLNCTTPAEKCQLKYEKWQKRAREYDCETRQYTCIMDTNKELVEACTWEYKIRTGTL